MFFIDYLHLFGINLDGTVSANFGPGAYGGGKYLDNLKMHLCPITSISYPKHFVQWGEKIPHFRTKISHLPSPLLGYLLMGILVLSDKYKKWAAVEKKKNSPIETLENSQSQKLRIGCTEIEKPQTTHHLAHVPYTNYLCWYNERENKAVNGTVAASCRESVNVTPRGLT